MFMYTYEHLSSKYITTRYIYIKSTLLALHERSIFKGLDSISWGPHPPSVAAGSPGSVDAFVGT